MFETKTTVDPMLKQMDQLREFNKRSWDACGGDQDDINVST